MDYGEKGMPTIDYNIGNTVCGCGRWWTTLREAIMGGYNCIEGNTTCDYCRDEMRNDQKVTDV